MLNNTIGCALLAFALLLSGQDSFAMESLPGKRLPGELFVDSITPKNVIIKWAPYSSSPEAFVIGKREMRADNTIDYYAVRYKHKFVKVKTNVYSFPLTPEGGNYNLQVYSYNKQGLLLHVSNKLHVYVNDQHSKIVDIDKDLMSDKWEKGQFGNLDSTPEGDPDNDGICNLVEFLNSMNPKESDKHKRFEKDIKEKLEYNKFLQYPKDVLQQIYIKYSRRLSSLPPWKLAIILDNKGDVSVNKEFSPKLFNSTLQSNQFYTALILIKYDLASNYNSDEKYRHEHLFYAITKNALPLAKAIYKRGGKLNIPTNANRHVKNVLDQLSKNGESNMISWVFENFQDEVMTNLKKPWFIDPMFIASDYQNIPMLEALIKQGVDINAIDSHGRTGLHRGFNKKNVADFYIKHGANLNMTASDGKSLLSVIVQSRRRYILEYYHKYGMKLNETYKDGNTPLILSVQSGSIGCTEFLLSKKETARINHKNHQGFTALHIAAKHDKIDAVKLLIEHGADVNAEANNGARPLSEAMDAKKSPSIIKHLFEKGAWFSQRASNKSVAKYVASDLFESNTAFQKKVFSKGIKPNSGFGRDETILGAAISQERLKTINILATAFPNMGDLTFPHSPLIRAARTENIDILKLLSKTGFNFSIDVDDSHKPNLLYFGIRSPDYLKYLLTKNIDVNKRDKYGNTILMRAVGMASYEICEMLLKAGADPMVKNAQDVSALDMAKKKPASWKLGLLEKYKDE